MLLPIIFFLPSIVSLLWFISFLMKNKSYRQGLFCYAEGISIVFYAVLGTYFYPDVDYDTMVRLETVGIPAGLLFPIFLMSYFYIHYSGRKMGHRAFFVLANPAVIVGVAINLLTFLIGFEQAAEVCRQLMNPEGLTGVYDTKLNHLYCMFRYTGFRVINYLNIAVLATLCFAILKRRGYRFGNVCRFFFRSYATNRASTIAFLYLMEMLVLGCFLTVGRMYISSHVILGILLTIMLAAIKHLIAYVEFYSDDERPVTLHELLHLNLYYGKLPSESPSDQLAETPSAPFVSTEPKKPSVPETPELAAAEEAPTITAAASGTPVLIISQQKVDKRVEQFRELMEVKKVWLDEDFSAQTLCDLMDIGRTTLSALINQHFDTTLRDMVNIYRIEEAKRYMKANPKATQEEVAQSCGFKSAQYFNTQFKKFVGDPPALWLAAHHDDN